MPAGQAYRALYSAVKFKICSKKVPEKYPLYKKDVCGFLIVIGSPQTYSREFHRFFFKLKAFFYKGTVSELFHEKILESLKINVKKASIPNY